jgi:hypothetical protein
MSLVAMMTCCWCGFSRWCRHMPDIGWCCDRCWEAAEGAAVAEEAA